ncbi:MAG TPA: alpha-isopropylmalate synthase regulatory domain-containing protein [Anaeromyxobacteraceae bacterium]|nr:alpha-isopropylmalate synthase regulatory domain-containing protein [Anaeromyxobacteraceae bacterium]
MKTIALYDATLTEGTRQAGVQLSVRDKLRVALRLAEMGVAYVEGGWAGRGGDAEIFREARRLELGGARLCACASVPRGGRGRAELAAALRCGAPAVALRTVVGGGAGRESGSPAAVQAAVRAVREQGRTALLEVDGFFDAQRQGIRAGVALVEAAARAGAEAVLLSDTSGGALPAEVAAGVAAARQVSGGSAVGLRARDDAGVAVANSLVAVEKGATIVAGTVNGYGERCGAADLVAIAAALELKMGLRALAPRQVERLGSLAHFVAELADREIRRNQAYVGRDAFTVTARVRPHVDPERVGNRAEHAMADERGHPGALRVARALGLPARGERDARSVLARLASWEKRGFRYEGAEASFDLLLRELAGRRRAYFKVVAYRVLDVRREKKGFTEATVEVVAAGEHLHTAALGVGPVNALDRALRRALEHIYPELADMKLVQSRSRSLPTEVGTAGVVRVLVDSADARDRWGTAGVSDNLLDACCQALVDAIEYKLAKDDVAPRSGARRR